MSGYNETAFTLSTSGYGSFKAKIDDKAQKIEYTLKYNDLEGDVTQSHIHLGRPSLTGGIMVWLCQTTAATTPTRRRADVSRGYQARSAARSRPPTCSARRHRASRSASSTRSSQAIRAGAAYANVHSTKYPGGEIRAPLGREGPRPR